MTDILKRLRQSTQKRDQEAAAEIERLREALRDIIELDHHNHAPESRATELARSALNNARETLAK